MKKDGYQSFDSRLFAQKLREMRKAKGWTRKDIQEKSDVSVNTYKDWEDNKLNGRIDLENLIAIADAYDVSIDYLLGRTDFQSVSGEAISEMTGLTDKAISRLEEYKQYADKKLSAGITSSPSVNSLRALNIILELAPIATYSGKETKTRSNEPSIALLSDLYDYLYTVFDKFFIISDESFMNHGSEEYHKMAQSAERVYVSSDGQVDAIPMILKPSDVSGLKLRALEEKLSDMRKIIQHRLAASGKEELFYDRLGETD